MQSNNNHHQAAKLKGELSEWATKSAEERLDKLSKFWQCPTNEDGSLTLVAKYEKSDKPDKNGNPYAFFVDIRDQDGDLLKYPYNLGIPKIWAKTNDKWEGGHWLIKVRIKQRDPENPFSLILANEVLGKPSNIIQEHIQKELFIRKIYKETGATERDAKNTVNALERITGDLYTERERFIFELLQNADDAPNEDGNVDTTMHLLSEHLLFLHNGCPFSEKDVESIASIGDSTKKKDSTTTGYKGIGFKALFTEVDRVIIRSGNFSFAFDKHSPLYKNKDITTIPWQLKPIWQERYRYPTEVRNHKEFMSSPVSLALSLTEPNLSAEKLRERLLGYQVSINNLFSEPRFLLFLRHVNSVKIKGLRDGDIHVRKLLDGDDRETLRLEIDKNLRSLWKVHSVEFGISEETREAMRGSKETPEKMKEMSRSKLSFAAKIATSGSLEAVSQSESVLFTYLPTSVNRYYLPFLVNADFLTTASREDIHRKNPWNIYIFEQIGYNVFNWIARLAQGEHRSEIVSIIPSRFNETELVTEAFNIGLDKALCDIAFLPTASGDLSKVSECFIDQTGWGEIIGDWIFELSPQHQGKLRLSSDLQDGDKLISRIGLKSFENKELYEIFKNYDFYRELRPETLFAAFEKSSIGVQDFVERTDRNLLNEWLGTLTDAAREQFIALLENSGLRQDTRKYLNNLRLWKFGEGLYDANSVNGENSNKVWLKPQVSKIVDILGGLGFIVSSEDYSSKYPNIYSHLSKRDDKSLFKQLESHTSGLQSLDFSKRKTLLLALTDQEAKWEGVGGISIASMPIFRNQREEYRSLNQLISPKVSSSTWLSEFILQEGEYFCEQEDLLIPPKEIYTKVILPSWEVLAKNFNEMGERQLEHLYDDIAHFYTFNPEAKPLSGLNFPLYANKENQLLHKEAVFYHKAIEQLSSSKYDELDLALRAFSLYLPHRDILSYLSDENSPFALSTTDESVLRLDKGYELSTNTLKTMVEFFVETLRWRFFEKWGISIIKKETFQLFESSNDRRQYWSKDDAVQQFIQEQISEDLCLLPMFLAKYKEEGGILSGGHLHNAILQRVCVEDYREVLVDFVAYSAKKVFLQEMGTIRVSLSSDVDDFTYKVINLAIGEKYSLRNQLEVDYNGVVLKLSELPSTLSDNFRVGEEKFSLSKLIPDADQESNIAIALLNKFIEAGLENEKLLDVFGFIEGENADEAIKRVVEFCTSNGQNSPVATNREQLLFFMHLEGNGKLPQGFSCYATTQEPYQGAFYVKNLSFIHEEYILSSDYRGLSLPLVSKSVQIYDAPIIDEDNEFKLSGGLRQNLEDSAKIELLSYLLTLYQTDPERFAKVEWDKLDEQDTIKILGFTPSIAVLAEEDYILEEEQIPEDIITWASDNLKQKMLFAMGTLPSSSPLIKSRKFLAGVNHETPNLPNIPDRARFEHTLRWLQEREIKLSNSKQDQLLQEIAKGANQKLEKRWLIDEISDQAVEWEDRYYQELRDTALSCRIYLHKERMPRGVFLREEGYLFYQYPSDTKSFKTKENIVYIHAIPGEDIQHELYQHLSPEDYGLIFASRINGMLEENKHLKQEKKSLEQENKALKQRLAALLPNSHEASTQPARVEGTAESKKTISLRSSSNNDLSEEERIEAQREAQKALMSEYPEWTFPEGYGTGGHYSVVRDVKDEQGNQMVIVLKSYRDRSQPLKITAEECEALLKEEGKLYLYTGTAIEERDFISLIGGQESITMSFDASNLTGEQDTRRIQKFVELLRYFKGLHIDIPYYNLSAINLYRKQEGGQIETTDDDL